MKEWRKVFTLIYYILKKKEEAPKKKRHPMEPEPEKSHPKQDILQHTLAYLIIKQLIGESILFFNIY